MQSRTFLNIQTHRFEGNAEQSDSKEYRKQGNSGDLSHGNSQVVFLGPRLLCLCGFTSD